MNIKTLFLATTALVIAEPSLAMAAEDANTIDTVVVTARKKSEQLLKVPIAVTAFTAKDIEARGIETMADIGSFTPGVNVDQVGAGGARSDRSFQTIIIRGMNPSTTQSPTTSVFVDGVPVDPDFIQNVDDVARIEVLKGPQSAFFGRSTFAGAVNVITNDPKDTFGGSVSAEVGTRNTQIYKGMVTGPIIQDVLDFRLGGFYNGHDGSYTNALVPGQNLGKQTTRGVDAALTFKPTSKLTIKASAQYFEDDDGPGATGLILPDVNQTNCTVGGYPYWCGTLPKLISSPAANTEMTPAIIANLANPSGALIKPGDAVKGFGLKRDAYHGALNINYDLPDGFNFTSLTGASYQDWSELSDLSNLDGPAAGYAGYTGFPFLVEQTNHQFSQEVRLASDQSKPLRGLIGLSYVESKVQIGGGYLAFYTPGVDAQSVSGANGAKTTGIFFSLAYDILPKFTINFDGRYQLDDLAAYTVTGATAAESKFYNFLPRVTGQYKFTPDVMGYFTYSEGVNPGAFNSTLQAAAAGSKGLTAAGVAYVESAYGAKIAVQPEHLTNYELGLKGRFWDGKATLTADIYYDKWTNQINSTSSALLTNIAYDTNVVLGPPLVPDLVGPFDTNTSRSTYEGFEVDGNIIPVEHVTLNVSGAVTGTRFDSSLCYTCYGQVQDAGKEAPNVSKYSAIIGAQYSNTLPYYGGMNWYVRGDFIYKSGVYLEEDNIEKTPDIATLNLRAGVSRGSVSLDGYVNNVTNDKAYTSGIPDFNFNTFNPAFMLGLPQLITFGLKLKYTF